jgi:hypothetical protein
VRPRSHRDSARWAGPTTHQRKNGARSIDDRRMRLATGGVRRIAAQEGHLPGKWEAVAEAGGTALVGAMTTNVWQITRSGVVGLFGRRGPAGQAVIEAQLDDHAALVSQAENADEVRQDLASTWRRNLEALLRQHPKAEDELRTLVVRVWETLPTPQQRWVQVNVGRNQRDRR